MNSWYSININFWLLTQDLHKKKNFSIDLKNIWNIHALASRVKIESMRSPLYSFNHFKHSLLELNTFPTVQKLGVYLKKCWEIVIVRVVQNFSFIRIALFRSVLSNMGLNWHYFCESNYIMPKHLQWFIKKT